MAGRKKVRSKDGELNKYGEEAVDWIYRRLSVVASMTDGIIHAEDADHFGRLPAQKRFNVSDVESFYLNLAARGLAKKGHSPYEGWDDIEAAINELDDGHQFLTEQGS